MKNLSVRNGIIVDVWATTAIVDSAIEKNWVNTGFVTNIKHTRAYQDIVSVVLFFGRESEIGQRHTNVTFSNICIIIVKYTFIVKIIIRSKLVIIVRIFVAVITAHCH